MSQGQTEVLGRAELKNVLEGGRDARRFGDLLLPACHEDFAIDEYVDAGVMEFRGEVLQRMEEGSSLLRGNWELTLPHVPVAA